MSSRFAGWARRTGGRARRRLPPAAHLAIATPSAFSRSKPAPASPPPQACVASRRGSERAGRRAHHTGRTHRRAGPARRCRACRGAARTLRQSRADVARAAEQPESCVSGSTSRTMRVCAWCEPALEGERNTACFNSASPVCFAGVRPCEDWRRSGVLPTTYYYSEVVLNSANGCST